ncbi:MAG: DUF262 domain-containing protein, partial [Bacteroidetes bacterium]|nr:DUF262 domain-containing protein [Bacteroidota bacterium]
LLRLPLPVFYFYGHEDEGSWEVIDGLQRLSAIKEFVIDKKLVLTNLEYLKNLKDLNFDQLTSELQIRIEEATITAYIITLNTPEEVKYTLFRRINTAALTLTPQEIRHALNQGTPANFLKELAQEEAFKKATCGKIPKNRMGDRDFVNRFVAFFVKGYEDYKPDLDTFLNDGLAEIKKKKPEELKKVKTAFINSMQYAAEVFGNDAFRKRYQVSDDRKPLNKALFDVWSYYFAKLTDSQSKLLVQRKEVLKEKFINLMNQAKFNRSVSSATGDPDNVKHRFSEIGKIIRETLEEA